MFMNVLLALLLSVGIVLVTGDKLIEWLRAHQMKTSENELGPQEHLKKRGTPIMGGLMIALGCVAAVLVFTIGNRAWLTAVLPLLFVSLGSMAVGLADDWTKAVKHRSEGLTPIQKIIGLSVVCIGFAFWCYVTMGSKVIVPFVNVEWDLGIFYIPLLALTVLFMTNSANLQDGIDGILSSVTSIGCMGWMLIAGLCALTVYQHLNGGSFGVAMAAVAADADPDEVRTMQDLYTAVAVFAAALCGGCLGFLRFNHYPAKIFMGDTGSMFIGGAVVGMAMLLRQPFLLLLIGFTCCMSSVSVILQRYYYKATRKIYGTPRRLFKMSPLHHHFEKCGMKETQIVAMYSIVTLVLTIIAVISVIV